MKKILSLFLVLTILLNGCTLFGGKKIAQLNIVLAPVEVPGDLLEAAKAFETDFTARLLKKGYNIQKLGIAVAPTNTEAAQALVDKQADIGFLPILAFADVLDDGVGYLLSTAQSRLKVDPLSVEAYNREGEYTETKELLPYRYSLIYTGPSKYGKELYAKFKSGQSLTWIDVNQASWCHVIVTSLDGYIYPSLWLIDQLDRRMGELYDHTLVVKGYLDMMAALSDESCDIAVGPDTLRNDYETLWTTSKDTDGFGRSDSIYNEVKAIGITGKIYDDVFALRPTDAENKEEILDIDFIKAIRSTLIEMTEDKEVSYQLFKLLGFEGLTEIDPTEYGSVLPALKYVQGIMN